ncbi:MAG: hypothetical protein EOM25_06225 [Deltaproteobacteria bacterium]|nr:hypothetical protein [Deltaproteobacteria bacterium]
MDIRSKWQMDIIVGQPSLAPRADSGEQAESKKWSHISYEGILSPAHGWPWLFSGPSQISARKNFGPDAFFFVWWSEVHLHVKI